MRGILLALQFLSVIPINLQQVDEEKIAHSLVFFPLAGLCLGLILCAANNVFLYLHFPQFLLNVLLVVLLVVLTGGMHLDGLADTADAFLSRKNKTEMLDIMRDSHIGVMGVLSLISIILLKIALLAAIAAPLKNIALLLMCVSSRWAMVLLIFLFPYARQEGKAKVFIAGVNLRIFLAATIVALVLAAAIWRVQGLAVGAAAAAFTFVIGKFINHKIGGITGDTLGAANEIVEAAVLFMLLLFAKEGLWIS